MLGGYQLLDFGGLELDVVNKDAVNTMYNTNNYRNKQVRVTGISLKDSAGAHIISPKDIFTMYTVINDSDIVVLKCLFTFESELRELAINPTYINVYNVLMS